MSHHLLATSAISDGGLALRSSSSKAVNVLWLIAPNPPNPQVAMPIVPFPGSSLTSKTFWLKLK
jgi:hypothetical protein